MRAEAAIATGNNWRDVLAEIVAQLPMLEDKGGVDLTLLFAHSAFEADFPELVAEVKRLTHTSTLIGCSGQGIIGPGREVEREPAIAIQTFSLPGSLLVPVRITEDDIAGKERAEAWAQEVNTSRYLINSWLAFADPFWDVNDMLRLIWSVYPGNAVVGGLASHHMGVQHTYLFLNDEVFDGGGVAVAMGGSYRIRPVVSQGCKPIGETWTITETEENVIKTIGMRRALDVLVETYHGLPENLQRRARTNLFIGLAMNEYKDDYGRGDFLVRNLLGIDQEAGSLIVNALPRPGQTLQFQLRDPEAADEDLQQLLGAMKEELGDNSPIGALLCCCNGRGLSLFGEANHDVNTVSEMLGPMPVAGFFCNGEIGPIGGKNFIHGYTASMGIIAKR
jgi:small ligand-binding sensory domain FIST